MGVIEGQSRWLSVRLIGLIYSKANGGGSVSIRLLSRNTFIEFALSSTVDAFFTIVLAVTDTSDATILVSFQLVAELFRSYTLKSSHCAS